ncbi:MAG: spermidine synthase [Planctomycetes bacterium]|nr:spermidine synthase [Planctomycetota bacterium]MCB9887803.1 spermidine synthase [Planctomycetota bacterium]
MIPRELLGVGKVPGHSGHGKELRCYRHDRDYSIWIDGIELMSSRVHGSEQALAELALDKLGPKAAPRILVGGLGMGFTLARALALVDEQARVDVAELVPEVVTWNRELFGHCAGNPLQDPRTHVVVDDVGKVIAGATGLYDAILLDVDNGPEGLSRPANNSLYNRPGLVAARAALGRGGVLAIWSSGEDETFERRLRDAGFAVKAHRVRARITKGPRRIIWVATRA